ncbi:triose-phosphate isomerase [Patescibacteria group bacterium]|nr:triose-phosphate isomerase [Patescibacteria group bacterium]
MNKDIWVIANWKSNKTIEEALAWVEEVGPKIPKKPTLTVVVCPSFVALEEVKKAVLVGGYPLLVGSQDLSPFEEGPYTGEDAAKQLAGVIDLAILGHSERRKNFGETVEMVTEKVTRALEVGITPLVCVQDQTTNIPDGAKLVAYEPIFAIGTGKPDTPQNADQVAEIIKKQHDLPVLYGGSINEDNAKAFLQTNSLSGLLIGGSSLNPAEFIKIVEIAAGI